MGEHWMSFTSASLSTVYHSIFVIEVMTLESRWVDNQICKKLVGSLGSNNCG